MKALGDGGKAELSKDASWGSDEMGRGEKEEKNIVSMEKVGEMLLKYGRPDLG